MKYSIIFILLLIVIYLVDRNTTKYQLNNLPEVREMDWDRLINTKPQEVGVFNIDGRWFKSGNAILEPKSSLSRWLSGRPLNNADNIYQIKTDILQPMEYEWLKNFQGAEATFSVQCKWIENEKNFQVERLYDIFVKYGIPVKLNDILQDPLKYHDLVIETFGVAGRGIDGLYLYLDSNSSLSKDIDSGVRIEQKSVGLTPDMWSRLQLGGSYKITGLFKRAWKNDGIAPNGSLCILYNLK